VGSRAHPSPYLHKAMKIVTISSVLAYALAEGPVPSSLLQKATNVKSTVMEQDLSGGRHRHGQSKALSGYEKYVSELVENVVAHNLTITSQEQSAIDMIFQFIEDMFADLVTENVTDDALLEQHCIDAVITCYDSRNAVTWPTLDAAFDLSKEKCQKHDECRAVERDLRLDMQQKCIEYDTYRQNPSAASPALAPECRSTDALSPAFIRAVDKDKRQQMEACLTEFVQWSNPLYPLYLACDRAKDNVTNITAICDGYQDECEEKRCTFTGMHDVTCTDYNGCYSNERDQCDLTCSLVQEAVAARKADNETAERVKCLMAIFNAENADKAGLLKSCKEATHDVSPWDITCPSLEPLPPPPIPCDRHDRPCEESWYQREYHDKSWFPVVKMQPCDPCIPEAAPVPMTTSTTPAPVPTAGPHGYLKCIHTSDGNVRKHWHRQPNTDTTDAGSEQCRQVCKDKGYMYFGFECPSTSSKKTECACGNKADFEQQTIPDERCAGQGVAGHNHCRGPHERDGWLFGHGWTRSIYLV